MTDRSAFAACLIFAVLPAGCASAPDPRPTAAVIRPEPLLEAPIDSTGIVSITEEQERQVADQ